MPSVTRKSHGNRAQRRDDVRRRLLAVVEELLMRGESYAEISVERLVSEAKLSRSTFYVYFEDKGDLLRAWFAQVIEELEDAAGRWWGLDGTATKADLRAALADVPPPDDDFARNIAEAVALLGSEVRDPWADA